MAAHTQPDAAQKIRALIQSLQRDDRLGAMEQLVVLSLQLGATSEPLSGPGLQTISQEAAKAVVRELNGSSAGSATSPAAWRQRTLTRSPR